MAGREVRTTALIALTALIGIGVFLFVTAHGIGLTTDSVRYVTAARNLLSGQGLSAVSAAGETKPMTHWPPLFPACLALIGSLGIDPLNGARWLNALLFGANAFLVGLMLKRALRQSFWTPILGCFLMISSYVMLDVHSVALSEPLFIFLSLLGLFLLAGYVESPKLPVLIASSLAIGLAFLTRYPGFALVAAGIVVILFATRKTWSRRIAHSLIFFAVGCVPIALWIVRNLCVAGAATDREIAFHPITLCHAESFLHCISKWLLPGVVPSVVRIIVLLVSVAGFVSLYATLRSRKERPAADSSTSERHASLPVLLALFIGLYGMLLVVSISFLDANTPLDDRILSPVYVSALILVLCLAHKLLSPAPQTRTLKVAAVSACILFAGLFLARGTVWVTRYHGDGRGIASRQWLESRTVARLKTLPPGTRVFTNARDAVYILTGIPARGLPRKLNLSSLRVNDNYLPEMAAMKDCIENRGALLVYFNTVRKKKALPSEDELKGLLPLRTMMERPDGVIYEARN